MMIVLHHIPGESDANYWRRERERRRTCNE